MEKTMKIPNRFTNRFFAYGVAFALAALAISPVQSQSVIIPPSVQGVAGMITADDTDIALLCKYVGYSPATTANSGTITVAVTSSDITFEAGPQGSESATAVGIECPVSGALDGIFDVSNAACDTLGEIVDLINVPASPFRCVILDGFRSDSPNARLLTMSETRATTNAGLGIAWDTSTAFDMTVAVVPTEYRSMQAYVTPGSRNVNHDVFGNSRTVVLKANATSTFATGTSFLTITSVNVNNAASGRSTESVTTLFNEVGGATTANKIFDLGAPVGIIGRVGEKVVARLDNSAAMSAAVLKTNGYMQRVGPP
jgi:hypothetical protein